MKTLNQYFCGYIYISVNFSIILDNNLPTYFPNIISPKGFPSGWKFSTQEE